jgi:hypothetical protein
LIIVAGRIAKLLKLDQPDVTIKTDIDRPHWLLAHIAAARIASGAHGCGWARRFDAEPPGSGKECYQQDI